MEVYSRYGDSGEYNSAQSYSADGNNRLFNAYTMLAGKGAKDDLDDDIASELYDQHEMPIHGLITCVLDILQVTGYPDLKYHTLRSRMETRLGVKLPKNRTTPKKKEPRDQAAAPKAMSWHRTEGVVTICRH
jgi:hypothetical protein